MHSQAEIEKVAKALLESQGLSLVSCKPLQTLWAGYGHICSIRAVATTELTEKTFSFILKYVSPPTKPGKRQDEGHLRKVISYQVEQHFYAHLAPSMPKEVAVASCLASVDIHNTSGNTTAMILSDLRHEFPVAGEKRSKLNPRQVDAAVDWLARFHGFWWTKGQELDRRKLRRPPLEEVRQVANGTSVLASDRGGVWLNGGYTYLATRRNEYADLMEDCTSEWATKLCAPLLPNNETLAERVARFLSPSTDRHSAISLYETLIHGDVKSENLFTTAKGDAVAFFDFQYVGLGLGACDLAKLFTCSLPEHLFFEGASDGLMHSSEERLLRRYLKRLEDVSGRAYDWNLFIRHWEAALVDWLRFQASWGFWGNTEWLEARVRTILDDRTWRTWLDKSVGIEEVSVAQR